jgi:hypothetical protein
MDGNRSKIRQEPATVREHRERNQEQFRKIHTMLGENEDVPSSLEEPTAR